MTDRELMQMALDALFTCQEDWIFDGEDERPVDTYDKKLVSAAFKALRARLAQPEQEPVAWMVDGSLYASKEVAQKMGGNAYTLRALYTAPPQRVWQGLTHGEIWKIDAYRNAAPYEEVKMLYLFARAIEAKLKEKNK